MKYIDFVKDYAKKHKIKYGEALKQSKQAWKDHKSKNEKTTKKGGNIQMDIKQIEEKGKDRRKLLREYKTLKKKLTEELDAGMMSQVSLADFLKIAKLLKGTSEKNQYAKDIKKFEKAITSRKFLNKVKKEERKRDKAKAKTDSQSGKESKYELKQRALEKATEIQLQRDLGYQVKRAEIVGKRKLVENRIKQLVRLGATTEEAEKIAKEEERDRKERSDLEKDLLIQRHRSGTSGLTTTGVSFSDFSKDYAKKRGITFNKAQAEIKSGNLYRKYQLAHIKGTAPSISRLGLDISGTTTVPASIKEKSKYLKRDGELLSTWKTKVDEALRKYGKDNSV